MPSSSVAVPKMSVYYPYIHVRDERWLKVAALYWPRMVRIVSPDYPTRNSKLVEILRDELDFILDVPPDDAARHVAEPFAAFVSGFGQTDLRRLRVRQDSRGLGPEQLAAPRPPAAFGAASGIEDETCVPDFEHHSPTWSPHRLPPDTAGIHHSEVAQPLADKLIDLRLAVPARGAWLAMSPELAWLYKCRLTEELARRNNLVPATDQMPAHAVMGGPVDVKSLLGRAGRPLKLADFQAGFGLLSINAVIPQDLDHVPAAKIVEIRRRFAAQFDRWRQYSDEVAAGLEAELQGVESPQVLQAYLDDAVQRYATGPADDIKRGLADIGLDAATTALNTKFTVPAAAVTGLVAPPIAAAGGIALAVTSLRRSALHQAQAKQAAPAAYLLSVRDELTPKTWLTQILAVMRRASGLRG